MSKENIEAILQQAISPDIVISNIQQKTGGDISQAFVVKSNKGAFFIKLNHASLGHMFETEASGLELLRKTNTLKIPKPIANGSAHGYAYMIMELLETGKRQPNFWENFGAQLAAMHQTTSSSYGLDHDNYIGKLPQSNKQNISWISFFINERLENQIKLARDQNSISKETVSKFEKLYPKLDSILWEKSPALLHGDLWSGNFSTYQDGLACIYDPAVYFGHFEMDLAFTQLFGGYHDRFYSAYFEVQPALPRLQERIDIYQLYPLLVHVNLFGGGYINQVRSILAQFV